MFIASPVDPCSDPESPASTALRTESSPAPLWQEEYPDDWTVEVFLNPSDFVLVYGGRPHHPIGSRTAQLVSLTSPGGDRITVREEDFGALVAALKRAEKFMDRNAGTIAVEYDSHLASDW